MSEAKCPQGGARCREDAALPAGWRRVRLGDAFRIIMGQSPESCYYNTKGIGVPLIQGNADIENRKSVARIFTSQSVKTCDAGDVILSVRAPVGAVGRASCKSCLGRGVCAIKSDSDFIYHYLIGMEDSWGRYSSGSTFDSINSNQLSKIVISLPPLPEQRAIAGVLGRVDRLVDNLAKRIAKKKAIKQGVMADLLTGRRRVQSAECGVQSAEFSLASRVSRPDDQPNLRDSVAPCENDGGVGVGDGSHMRRRAKLGGEVAEGNGEVARKGPRGTETRREEVEDFNAEEPRSREDAALPAGWRRTTYGELGTVIGGGTPSTSVESFWNGEINWFTPAEIGESKYVSKSERRITDSGLRNSAARILPPGSILLTTRASIGLTAINLEPTATNQGFQSLIVNESNDVEFVYYFIDTLKHEMISRASGSTFLEISPNKLKSIPISIPPLPEQRAIAGVLGAMDAEIAKLEAKKVKIERLKQGLMSDLLSGKVRVQV